MDTVPARLCQLCGQHQANRVTTDHQGNACWYCGYCQRWHPGAIDTFLHAKRLFHAWQRSRSTDSLQGEQRMQPSQRMQKIIEALATKHGVDLQVVDAALKLTLPGYMPLVIRNVGLHQVSVYHFFLVQDDVVPDPQIIFWVTPQGWYPIAVTQTIGGHRAYARLNEDGTAVLWVAQKAQADLARFAELWATNLKAQGWLERGEPVPKALFPLGEIFLTPGARAIFATTGMDPARMLERHVTGDWAELSEHDRLLNQRAVQAGEERIFSAYALAPGVTIWVITEADRSSTTLLLPAEY